MNEEGCELLCVDAPRAEAIREGLPAGDAVLAAAGIILLWRFAASRASSEEAERRAQRLIGVTFYAIALYVGFETVRSLLTGERPEASWVGIGLAAVTLATMPPLATAKARPGEKLGSSATKSESQQNMLCAYLSAALLITGVAVREGRESRRGESCCAAPVVADTNDCCDDDRCDLSSQGR